MNTKTVMVISAVTMGMIGIVMTFVPDIILNSINIEPNKTALLLIQIMGAFYFSFGMLNWMSKTNIIGGIYNRPIAVANFTHFLIAGLALSKSLISNPDLPINIWIASFFYVVFVLLFGIILFSHPLKETKADK